MGGYSLTDVGEIKYFIPTITIDGVEYADPEATHLFAQHDTTCTHSSTGLTIALFFPAQIDPVDAIKYTEFCPSGTTAVDTVPLIPSAMVTALDGFHWKYWSSCLPELNQIYVYDTTNHFTYASLNDNSWNSAHLGGAGSAGILLCRVDGQ